jgi:hypothetical protein
MAHQTILIYGIYGVRRFVLQGFLAHPFRTIVRAPQSSEPSTLHSLISDFPHADFGPASKSAITCCIRCAVTRLKQQSPHSPSVNRSRLERSRWRGRRFACYAPRVMLQRTHRIRVLAHAHFLSAAKPIAYRWAKRLNSHSH